MTADGTDDDKIKREGLNDYKVPPPMLLLDPANAEPSSNDITPGVRGLYENGCFDGVVVYYNKSLAEYAIHYSDGSRDFVKDQDFDGVELFFC